MWQTFRIICGIVLAVFGAMVGVKPDDAVSNVSAWISLITDNVPVSLTAPSIDRWAMIILFVGAFFLWFGPWLYRRIKKLRRSDFNEAKGTQTEKTSHEAVRDVKLVEALAYYQLRQWGGNFIQQIGDGFEGSLEPLKAFRQAAVDGEIRTWGKVNLYSPYIKIPSDYWHRWHINFLSLMGDGAKTERALSGSSPEEQYEDVMVSKAEFEAKWPPSK